MEIEPIFREKRVKHRKKKILMRILIMRQYNLQKNILELIIYKHSRLSYFFHFRVGLNDLKHMK